MGEQQGDVGLMTKPGSLPLLPLQAYSCLASIPSVPKELLSLFPFPLWEPPDIGQTKSPPQTGACCLPQFLGYSFFSLSRNSLLFLGQVRLFHCATPLHLHGCLKLSFYSFFTLLALFFLQDPTQMTPPSLQHEMKE